MTLVMLLPDAYPGLPTSLSNLESNGYVVCFALVFKTWKIILFPRNRADFLT